MVVEHMFQQTCRDGSFCLLNMNGYTWLCLSGKIAPRAYHAAVIRFKRNTPYIIGVVQLQDDNAVQYCSIHEITAVQFNLKTKQIVSSVCDSEFPMSTQAATISNNIVDVFGGHMAKDKSIPTTPEISSILFAFDFDKLGCLSKAANDMHATAGHNMFALGISTLLICGGTK